MNVNFEEVLNKSVEIENAIQDHLNFNLFKRFPLGNSFHIHFTKISFISYYRFY
jgi:hypothetical protein